ncbi:MAG: hypothetical protein JWP69_980 [Flaviaesturariibacter sp.]|nr:hypothetical protein [Flaviaesturariibacter sp.]
MTTNSETIHGNTLAGKLISWLFGTAVLATGIVNTFWGEPTGFGIFLILLSFVYFLPVNAIVKGLTGYSVPGMRVLRIVLALFILWVVLGVGDLFEKIELMKLDLNK